MKVSRWDNLGCVIVTVKQSSEGYSFSGCTRFCVDLLPSVSCPWVSMEMLFTQVLVTVVFVSGWFVELDAFRTRQLDDVMFWKWLKSGHLKPETINVPQKRRIVEKLALTHCEILST